MYQQQLPPRDDSPGVAEAWARGIALHENRPDLAEVVGFTAQRLVSQAIGRTPADGRVHVEITVTEAGIKVETHDPGRPDPSCGSELREVSTVTTSYGSRIDSTWALAGDRHEALAAIRRADNAMTRSDPSSDPQWLATFTPAHHAGSVMHALRELGLYDQAARHASPALDLPAAHARARALHQVLLATVHVGRGDLEAACASAGQALDVYPYLASARLRARLGDVDRRLRPHHGIGCVRDYIERSRELLTTP